MSCKIRSFLNIFQWIVVTIIVFASAASSALLGFRQAQIGAHGEQEGIDLKNLRNSHDGGKVVADPDLIEDPQDLSRLSALEDQWEIVLGSEIVNSCRRGSSYILVFFSFGSK